MNETDRPVRVAMCGRSDVGEVRSRNEDEVLFGDLGGRPSDSASGVVECSGPTGPMLIVCDGLGGAAGGSVASELAARTIWQFVAGGPRPAQPEALAERLVSAISAANACVAERAQANPSLVGMATTASVAAIAGDSLVVAQVGDSRVYLRRGRHLVKLTRDQSLTGRLVAAGKLSESEARLSDGRSVVLQAVGLRKRVGVTVTAVRLSLGDRLLACSDGLHDVVGEGAIRNALAIEALEAAADRLIGLAKQAGGPDNVSVIVADIVEGPDPAEGSEPVVAALQVKGLVSSGRRRVITAIIGILAVLVALWLLGTLAR